MGKIKLDKYFLQSEFYNDPKTSRLFIHLNLISNEGDSFWWGHKVCFGHVLTSLKNLAHEMNDNRTGVHKSLCKLIQIGEIKVVHTNFNYFTGDEISDPYKEEEALIIEVLNRSHSIEEKEFYEEREMALSEIL